MVDFYLRWWSGHHCIYMGYEKVYRSMKLGLEGVDGKPTTAEAAAANPTITTVLALQGRWCDDAGCLRCVARRVLP